jgi:acyl-homoserine-lactone acylase
LKTIPRLIVSAVLGCVVPGALLSAQAAQAVASTDAATGAFTSFDLARMKAGAQRVTILRDKWGIPHVFGKSDADAVFGMVFAQAEDDFNRVELNYINAMGRLAEVEGEKEIWRDLRMKLYIDPADMQAKYAASPAWLKKLMNAWADGLNWYLATHPQVKPKLLSRFEPWMALSFSEGSIGGDIESIDLKGLEAFYGKRPAPTPLALADLGKGFDPEPSGSKASRSRRSARRAGTRS